MDKKQVAILKAAIQDNAAMTLLVLQGMTRELEQLRSRAVVSQCPAAHSSINAAAYSLFATAQAINDMYELHTEGLDEDDVVDGEYIDHEPEPTKKKTKKSAPKKLTSRTAVRAKATAMATPKQRKRKQRDARNWARIFSDVLEGSAASSEVVHEALRRRYKLTKSASYNAVYIAIKKGIIERDEHGMIRMHKNGKQLAA